jgi:hypothetical protein
MSNKLTAIEKSPLFTELTAEESEFIQGGLSFNLTNNGEINGQKNNGTNNGVNGGVVVIETLNS